MEVALGHDSCSRQAARIHNVSILVFVEVALGLFQTYSFSSLKFFLSFNPCFRGSRPRTGLIHRLCPPSRPVSILVFVEVALGLIHQAGLCRPQGVSILVFVEVALGHSRH